MAQCRALMSRKFAPTDEELQSEEFLALNADTSDMYGLMHANYIRSPEGKYPHLIKTDKNLHDTKLVFGRFGTCVRKVPEGWLWVLPTGLL